MAATSASEKSAGIAHRRSGPAHAAHHPRQNGPFTVGRLATHLGVFEVKDPELEQYPRRQVRRGVHHPVHLPRSHPGRWRMRFEIRASLDGMTLNGIDKLSRRSPQLRHPGRRSAR